MCKSLDDPQIQYLDIPEQILEIFQIMFYTYSP